MQRWAVLFFTVCSVVPVMGSNSVSVGDLSEEASSARACAAEVEDSAFAWPLPSGSLEYGAAHLLALLVPRSRALESIAREWERFVWADREFLARIKSRNPDRRRRYVEAESFIRVLSYAGALESLGLISRRNVWNRYDMLSISDAGLNVLSRIKTSYAVLQDRIGAGWLLNFADSRDRSRFPAYSPRHVEVLGSLFHLEHRKPGDALVTEDEWREHLESSGIIRAGGSIGFLVEALVAEGLVARRERNGVSGVMYTAKTQTFLRNVFAYFEALSTEPVR